MILEVVSPEATLFSGEVNSVAVPGANGVFQVLDNHAPIVSILNPGTVKIGGKNIIASSFLKMCNITVKRQVGFINFFSEIHLLHVLLKKSVST